MYFFFALYAISIPADLNLLLTAQRPWFVPFVSGLAIKLSWREHEEEEKPAGF